MENSSNQNIIIITITIIAIITAGVGGYLLWNYYSVEDEVEQVNDSHPDGNSSSSVFSQSTESQELSTSSSSDEVVTEIEENDHVKISNIKFNSHSCSVDVVGEMKGFFEATMNFDISDKDRNIIDYGYIMPNEHGGWDEWLDFSESIDLSNYGFQTGEVITLDFLQISMKDGSKTVYVTKEVVFEGCGG